MKFLNVIDNTAEFIKSIRLKRDPRLSKLDFGILRVSMMVAALDGEVRPSEVSTFRDLARKCRGYTAKSAEESFEAALRSAGYLMLLSQTSPEKRVLSEFVEEALTALPSGFLNGSVEDVRRAFVIWVAMAMGDGDYSDIERHAIAALKKTWCELKSALVDSETEQWLTMSPTFRMAYTPDRTRPATIKLIADDFLERVEAALARFDEAKLADIIKNG